MLPLTCRPLGRFVLALAAASIAFGTTLPARDGDDKPLAWMEKGKV
jgi:hypothetical protein